jgi:hypothetical protein
VGEKRIALVIGNADYTNSPLKNPVNDAKDIASKLRKLGFEVIERHNMTTKQIGRTLSEFRSKLVVGSVALVFYAGHGIQIKGENFLPAVDADIEAEEDVPNQSLAVKQIMDVLDEAKTRLNLVFLDACRNNPYARSFRSTAGDGLARITAPSGTLISYATRPGSVAGDGAGRNGLYTSKLLLQMNSNLQIEQALKQVVTEVKAASQGKQEPWMEGSIEGDFCFKQCGNQIANFATNPEPNQMAKEPPSEEVELAYWDSIKDSKDFRDFDSYLEKYPNGNFAGIAKFRSGNWLQYSKGCNIWLSNGVKSSGMPENLTWSGECLNGKANGKGIVQFSRGGIRIEVESAYKDGFPLGAGTGKAYKDGNLVSSSEFTLVQILGTGDVITTGKTSVPGGLVYEGQFLNGKPSGNGILTFPTGEHYEGEFSDGMRNGHGINTLPNGERQEGTWANDQFVH